MHRDKHASKTLSKNGDGRQPRFVIGRASKSLQGQNYHIDNRREIAQREQTDSNNESRPRKASSHGFNCGPVAERRGTIKLYADSGGPFGAKQLGLLQDKFGRFVLKICRVAVLPKDSFY